MKFKLHVNPAAHFRSLQAEHLLDKKDAADAPTGPQHPAFTLRPDKFRLDLMTDGEPPSMEFVLHPLFRRGTTSLLFGPGGVSKTLQMIMLGLEVAWRAVNRQSGPLDFVVGPFGGTVPPEAAGAVILITTEDGADEIHRRRAAIDPQMRCAGAPFYVIPTVEVTGFDSELIAPAEHGRRVERQPLAEGGLDAVIERVEEHAGVAVSLLILDPAGDFMGGDENSAEYVKAMMRLLREVATRHHCAVILVGHTPKGAIDDAAGPTMRGSGAWIANSRSAYGLWPPAPADAAKLGKQHGVSPHDLVFGMLVKANHPNAPVGRRKLFRRCRDTGRLSEIMPGSAGELDEAELLDMLVTACAAASAAGFPFTKTATGGLFADRADLPPVLADLSRHRLEGLAQAALDAGRLVKAGKPGALKWLDTPDGRIARGGQVPTATGSRRDAIARRVQS